MLFTDPVKIGGGVPIAILGGILGITGVALFGAAVRSKQGFQETTGLVTTGVYSRLRHPMYLGILLIHLGFPLLTDSALSIFSAVLWAPQILLWKHWEDEELEERFGETYRGYRRQTFF